MKEIAEIPDEADLPARNYRKLTERRSVSYYALDALNIGGWTWNTR